MPSPNVARALAGSRLMSWMVCDSRGRILEMSPSARRMLGWEAVADGPASWLEITPPQQHPLDRGSVRELATGGFVGRRERILQRRDGSLCTVLAEATVLDPEHDTILITVIDIDDYKGNERKLHRRAALDRLLFLLSKRVLNHSGADVARIVDDGLAEICEFLGADECCVFEFGADPTEDSRTYGRPRTADRGPIARSFDFVSLAHMRSQILRQESLHIRDTSDDDTLPREEIAHLEEAGVRSLIAVPTTAGGKVRGCLVLASIGDARDWHAEEIAFVRVLAETIVAATGRLRAEASLRRANDELERRVAERTAQLHRINEQLEAFSYSVSHDLRSPLRAIQGYSEILLQDHAAGDDVESRRLLERIRDAATRQSASIDAILGLARLGRSRSQDQCVDLSALAREVVTTLRAQTPAHSIEVTIESAMTACGSPELLESLLANLIGNAWKYSEPRPEARIEFGRCAADGTYYVRDNGIGFDPAKADRLFRPFQRLHDDGARTGHGVGLATVRRIVELHGGRVWAESTPQVGTTFYFTLGEGTSESAAG